MPETGAITDHDGGPVSLRRQSRHVLAYLIARAGKVVSREELMAAIWRDVVVTDDSLSQCVADIRRAVGDRDRVILRTIPKVGFVLDCQPPGARREPEASPTDPAEPARLAVNRPLRPTIAIIPFRARRAKSDDAIYGDLLADDLIQGLARSHDLKVTSRLSAAMFRDSAVGLTEIAQALSADYVLSGSVLSGNGMVTVWLEFCDYHNGKVVWAERASVPVSGLLEEIWFQQGILGQMRKAIFLSETDKLTLTRQTNLQAYSKMLGALGLMHRPSRADFEAARTHLCALAESGPKDPAPAAWLGRWYDIFLQQGWADKPKEAIASAMHWSQRALEIAPDHSVALTTQAIISIYSHNKWEEARSMLDTALDAYPSDATARGFRACLRAAGKDEAGAIEDIETALRLVPFDPDRFYHLYLAAATYLFLDRLETALEHVNASMRKNPSYSPSQRIRVIVLMGLGRAEEARAQAKLLMIQQPNLRVSSWRKNSAFTASDLGQWAGEMLVAAGVPE